MSKVSYCYVSLLLMSVTVTGCGGDGNVVVAPQSQPNTLFSALGEVVDRSPTLSGGKPGSRYLTQSSAEVDQTVVKPVFVNGTGADGDDSLSDLTLDFRNAAGSVIGTLNMKEDGKSPSIVEPLTGETGRTLRRLVLEKTDNDQTYQSTVLVSWDSDGAIGGSNENPSNYLAMGYWRNAAKTTNSASYFGAFVGGAEFDGDPSIIVSQASPSNQSYSATYKGIAQGYHTNKKDKHVGEFSASLQLDATFNATPDDGSNFSGDGIDISGCLGCDEDGIIFDGVTSDYQLKMAAANLPRTVFHPNSGPTQFGYAFGTFTSSTTLEHKTNGALDGATGSWTGLFGQKTAGSAGVDKAPIYVGGTAGVSWENGNRDLLGAWIGYRQ